MKPDPQRRPARRPRFPQGDRRGVILTTAMIFILPVVVVVSLSFIQVILIEAALDRVRASSLAAVQVAANGGTMDETHHAAGLMLGYLGGDYKTERQYFELNGDPGIQEGDEVSVGVTMPMALVTNNFMGLLGVSVEDLRIRDVKTMEMQEAAP